MLRKIRLSLATKCQLLFGAAVVLLLTAALTVVSLRMSDLVDLDQKQIARELSDAWLDDMIQLGGAFEKEAKDSFDHGITLQLIDREEFDFYSETDVFIGRAIERFDRLRDLEDVFVAAKDVQQQEYYRYARAIRRSDLERMKRVGVKGKDTAVEVEGATDPLEMVLVIQRQAEAAKQQIWLNNIYLVMAGLFAGLLAIGVFWFITTKLILSPVRLLKDTTEKIAAGDLNVRAEISTGDEFEQLGDMFNQMLETLKQNEDDLRGVAKSLDLKLGELAETNVSLYEADKMKGEFLANVSHELRTPLHSIVGFAEVLAETVGDDPANEKQKRYANNIVKSSKRLLELINELLDLAKIEAGRMDLSLAAVSVADTVEGLVSLVRLQAEKSGIELRSKVLGTLPAVRTDAGRLQQILFNFLSNAVKFTPEGGEVMLSAELVVGEDDGRDMVRFSVTDSGPGIAVEDHDLIFEKFVQLGTTHTKEHSGTGLGLTISKELATLLRGRIELESDVGKPTTFSLLIPVMFEEVARPLMPEGEGGGEEMD